jgi:hypothetical protein
MRVDLATPSSRRQPPCERRQEADSEPYGGQALFLLQNASAHPGVQVPSMPPRFPAFGSVILLSILCVHTPAAQTADRVIGLLTLPEVFGGGPCDKFDPREVPLYQAPGSSAIAGSIRVEKTWTYPPEGGCDGLEVKVHRKGGVRATDLPTEEYEYEAPAAIVLEARGRWFRVRLADGSAWVRASDRNRYLPLRELLGNDALTHFTDDWDGTLKRAPGAPESVRLPIDERRRIVGYLEPLPPRARIELFDAPDKASQVRGWVTTDDVGLDLTSFNSDRTNVVPVFSRRPGWFEVAFADTGWRDQKRAWLPDGPAWRFRAVDDEVEAERLISKAWGPQDRGVRVLGFRTIGDAIWIEVEVLDESGCGVAIPSTIAKGWVPAHAASGAVTIWFSSRGC